MRENQSDNSHEISKEMWFSAFGISAILILFSYIASGGKKEIDKNYKPAETFSVSHGFSLKLETELEEELAELRARSPSSYRSVAQIYIYVNNEKLKCWYIGEEDDLAIKLYNASIRQIELKEATLSIARGEKAVHRKGHRYCKISQLKFKHFIDIEYLAFKTSNNDKELYEKYIHRYKGLFY